MIIIQSIAGMFGTAVKNIKYLISTPMLQIVTPSISTQTGSVSLISSPKVKPLLQIVAPNQLLISEPEYNVSVFLTEYDKGLRCLILNNLFNVIFNCFINKVFKFIK